VFWPAPGEDSAGRIDRSSPDTVLGRNPGVGADGVQIAAIAAYRSTAMSRTLAPQNSLDVCLSFIVAFLEKRTFFVVAFIVRGGRPLDMEVHVCGRRPSREVRPVMWRVLSDGGCLAGAEGLTNADGRLRQLSASAKTP
jgi:hypothetical protein